MTAMKLLAASVDMPPQPKVDGEPTSLVHADRIAVATRTIAQNDTAYPDDRFVWSASADDNGTFNFYAVPLKNSGNDGASNQWGSLSSAHLSSSNWYTHNAVFQYALHASMPTPIYGRLINLYA